jgi:hypothetical protein
VDALAVALLDDGHAADTVLVAGEAGADVVQVTAVDLEDDLEVARQQLLHQLHRPALKRLGKHRVVLWYGSKGGTVSVGTQAC